MIRELKLKTPLIAIFAAAIWYSTGTGQENIAPTGQAILGYSAADDGTLGTEYEHAGSVANVNDGNLATRTDTWGGAASDVPYDYVGVTWPEPIADEVETVRLTMATFFDGGWFGSGGAGSGRALTADDVLPVPKIQFTSGGTWFDLPGVVTDYAATMEGHNIGGGAFPNPSTAPTVEFTLASPLSGIDGIRVFGEGGGNAGADSGGFLGVFELEVYSAIPEPASMSIVWGLLLSGCSFLRRRASN